MVFVSNGQNDDGGNSQGSCETILAAWIVYERMQNASLDFSKVQVTSQWSVATMTPAVEPRVEKQNGARLDCCS